MAFLPAAVDSLPDDRDLVVLCHHGVRSALAVRWLRDQGFDRAVNLEGGIDAWARRIAPDMRRY
jgi:rhodanese-related sulfurtransferase